MEQATEFWAPSPLPSLPLAVIIRAQAIIIQLNVITFLVPPSCMDESRNNILASQPRAE